MVKNFSANTEEAGVPILGAEFWRIGERVGGIYVRSRESEVGIVHEFIAAYPAPFRVKINPSTGKIDNQYGELKTIERFGMGALTGFEMCLQVLAFKGFQGFIYGDKVMIKCVGQREPKSGQSPMLEFSININREDKQTTLQPPATAAQTFNSPTPAAPAPISDEDIPF